MKTEHELKVEAEYRTEVLNNRNKYPELYRIETAKNQLRFRGELDEN